MVGTTIKLSDANVCWVPRVIRRNPARGAVWVTPYWDNEPRTPGELWSRANAGFGPIRASEGDVPAQALSLLSLFHTIVVRDLITPERAHEALLQLGIYREVISPDIKGAA
jgi:hypothetical protein